MEIMLFVFALTVDPPIVLRAKSLPLLERSSSYSINVYVYRSGLRQLIPFQIDEKDRSGEYLTRYLQAENGRGYVLRKDGWRFGEFNGDDELVFMKNDCGDKAPMEDLSKYIYEVEVKGESTCYFYISKDAQWRDSRSYVEYDPDEDFFRSDYFAYGSVGLSNPAVLNFFKITNLPDSLIKRFHINLFVSTLWGKVKIEKSEEDVRMNIAGYTDGPVRVIKVIDYRMVIGKGIESPKTRRISISYRRCGEFPTQVALPIKPSLVIDNAHLLLSFEFTSLINRFSAYIDGVGESKLVEFKGEKGIPSQNSLILKSDGTNIIAVLDMDEELINATSRTLIMKRDMNDNFWIAWKIEGFENLKSGNYAFTFKLCTGDAEEKPFTIILHSLKKE